MNKYAGALRLSLLGPLAVAVGLAMPLATFGAAPPPGVAPFLSPAGGLAIDGDVCANTPIADTGDWVLGTNSGSGGALLNTAGVPINPVTSFHFIDPYGNAGPDEIFVGGLKWTDNPNLWQCTQGKSSSKTDINNVLLHIATDSDSHIWVAVAADRFSTSGDSYIDFEFLQNPLIKSNAQFISFGPHGGRTTNDLLLSLAFTGGGKVADFFAWSWQPNGSGGYGYVDVTASLPAGRVFVALNSNTTVVPYGAFGKTTYAPNAYAEAAVDLTALLGTFDRCVSFGFKTIMVKTKASASTTASIEDFINPIQYTLRIGPGADPGPDQARCTEGDFTSFPLVATATSGLAPISSTTWSVVSGTAEIEAPNSLQTLARVYSQTATLRLTVVQADGCTHFDDVVLTVKPLPSCSITGPAAVCPQVPIRYSAPAGMAAYSWTISGNGTITGADNLRTVTVLPGNACGQNFTLTSSVTSNGCPAVCSADVLVNDVTPPTISCPADLVLECPADTRTNATGVATAQDGCGYVAITYSDAVAPGCANTKVISRTWTAADRCGNVASCVQTITVRDSVAPAIVCPPNRTLECPADTAPAATGVATAQDACGAVTINYTDAVTQNCATTRVITRTWTATDDCGNASSCVQTITVRDTIKPLITCPPNLTLECPADTTTNATGVATAQDGCSAVTIRYTDAVTNNCAATKVITRTWTAADECGNSASCVQTITVRDTIAPSIICPANVVLDCPADTRTNATGIATATDGCGTVTIAYTDSVVNNCAGTKVITRTWTATDQCGNKSSCAQTITVRDISGPSLVSPPDIVLECPADTRTNITGIATAQDVCSLATISYTDAITNGCSGTKVIARTWKALDGCGNLATAVQMITVSDTIKPTLTIPADVVLECLSDTSTRRTGTATASDGCSAVTIAYTDAVTEACGATKVIARTWTATDACGNVASAVQTITLRDSIAPTITCPANRILECPADTRPEATGVATGTDACGAVTISYSDSVTNNCAGAKVIARTWTATDECGNTSACVQTITVRDTIKPTIVCPANVTLECPADTRTNVTGIATAQDACGAVTIAYSDAITEQCAETRIIARTWTATDECGNSMSCVQTITVRDTTPPVITCPANRVLECPADTRTNVTGVATASDVCGGVTVTYADAVTNNCGGTKVIARTWTATDECGNSAKCVQTITVQDIVKPILTLPPNQVLQCPADTRTNLTGVATATDACSAAAIRYSDLVTTNCGGTKVIARTWTATDECGNAVSGVQTITVQDLIAPSLTCPPDRTMECPADTRTNVTGVATASDACGNVTITYSDSVQNNCAQTKVIRRTWTATDECGNRQSCVQTITVLDTVKPTISVPPDQVVECGASTAPSATGTATAQDGCGQVTITYNDSAVNGCGGSKVITRTWTATDTCGNSTNKTQTITVRDTTPPALTLPANRVLQCPGDTRTSATGVASASDVCGSVTVTYSDVVSNSCALTKTVWRTWTAVDSCGNSTDGVQTITVIDTTKPSITCPSVSVQCVDNLPAPYTDLAAFLAAGGRATDSCSSILTFALMSDSGLVGRCPGRVTRVYRVTDECGNFGECTQTITVDDTIAPVLTCPTNTTVECGVSIDPATTGRATATDNCSTAAVAYTDVPVSSEYSINFYAADPDLNTGPYGPTYLRLGPASLPRPVGRALDPLRNAVAFAPTGQMDALTSLGGEPMALGQVIPFEAVIGLSGGPGPERGVVEFTVNWSTYTTSNDRFGFDTNYMVYCAFVDAADPGFIDPHHNAKVESFRSKIINAGSIDEQIQGTFRVSGLDLGDQVVVEIWMVFDSRMPDHVGGTIAAQLVSAEKVLSPPEPITVGSKTISIGNLNKCGPLPPPQPQPPLGPLPVQPPVPPGATVSVIDRRWEATDDCGNRSTCVQRFTIRDTAPPVLSVPALLTLECPADTSTNATGVATAVDECGGSVLLSYSDSVTNGCAGTKMIARTWTARDQYSNTVSAVQTIIVNDTTPPAMTCPADATLEYPADTSTVATGVATAQDLCGSVTLTHSDVVTAGFGNGSVIVRTWTATDECGYSSTCVQTITVLDPRVVQSNFDTTDDGWLVIGSGGSQVPICVPDGGQNGGYVSPGDGATGTVWYWMAPPSYLGDRSANYDGTFQFALMQNGSTSPTVTVTLSGNGITLVYTITQPIGTDWTTYTVSLNEAGWINSDAQQPATQAEIIQVLSSLSSLGIKVDYGTGTGSVALDSVALLPPATVPTNWVLSMGRSSAGAPRLSWPALAAEYGYVLEASDSLSTPNWTVVSGTPLSANGLNYIDLNPTQPMRFFRLRLSQP